MEKHLKKRLLGAFVTVVLLAILVPILVDGSKADLTLDTDMASMPPLPDWTEVDNQDRIRIDLEKLASGEATAELQPPQPDIRPVEQPPVAKAPGNQAVTDAKGLPYAWELQVGAFSARANAIALQNDLRKKGYKAYVRADRDSLVRVFVGPEIKREDIDRLKNKLQKQLGQNLYVKRYEAR